MMPDAHYARYAAAAARASALRYAFMLPRR